MISRKVAINKHLFRISEWNFVPFMTEADPEWFWVVSLIDWRLWRNKDFCKEKKIWHFFVKLGWCSFYKAVILYCFYNLYIKDYKQIKLRDKANNSNARQLLAIFPRALEIFRIIVILSIILWILFRLVWNIHRNHKIPRINSQAPVAQKIADEVIFRRFQGEGVEFF